MYGKRFLLLSVCMMGLTACSNVKPGLRDDLNNPNYAADSPTTGGMFPEGRWFDRGGRGPASGSSGAYTGDGRRNDWLNDDARGAQARDTQRGPASTDGAAPEQAAQEMPYKHGARATRDDFVDEGMTDGSLWASTGQTNYFFTKNRIRSPGDIITIKVDDNLIKNAAAELKRALTKPEVEAELDAARKKKSDELAKTGGRSTASAGGGAAASGDKSKEDPNKKPPEVEVTFADIDPQPSMTMAAGDLMMGEIVERYPNGNYKIRGSKRVQYRGTMRVLNMVGIARIQDVSEEDTVEAGKLYEYRLKFANNL